MAVYECKSLVKKLDELDNAVLCVVWNDILQRMNIVSKCLQEPGIELCNVVNLYDSLIKHFREMRNCTDTTDPAGFHAFEQKAKCNSHVNADYCESHARKRVRKSMPDDGPASDLELTASDRFRTQVFYVILDKLLVEMERRKTAYNAVCRKFSFLTDRSLNSSQVRSSATNLVDAYKKDLDIEFVDEFVLFSELCGTEKSVSVSTMIQFMIEKKLNNCFPNVNIALRIYLSILGTSCESERSFLCSTA